MLKQRVITALIAAPLAVAAIFLLPAWAFAVLFAALALLGLLEWGKLVRFRATGTVVFAGAATLPMALLYLERALWGPSLAAFVVVWLGCFVAVLTYPRSSVALASRPLVAALGWILLVSTWLSFVMIQADPAGAWLILWLFLVVWGADVGAYFAGRAFGRHKLAPRVSPGKTWEGVVGGLVLGVSAATLLAVVVPMLAARGSAFGWLALGIAVGGVSILGDLFESVIKRVQGVKDSGGLLPGHGGWLDRIDAIMAAVPFFALALLFDQPAL